VAWHPNENTVWSLTPGSARPSRNQRMSGLGPPPYVSSQWIV
jgi:hypothetical protein